MDNTFATFIAVIINRSKITKNVANGNQLANCCSHFFKSSGLTMTDFSFSCRMDNVKTISDVLNCLCVDVHKDQPCQVEVTQEGENAICHTVKITQTLIIVFIQQLFLW